MSIRRAPVLVHLLTALAMLIVAGVTIPSSDAATRWSASAAPASPTLSNAALTAAQQSDLLDLADRTWSFFAADVDPKTNLPRIGVPLSGSTTGQGTTSPTAIGLYLTAVVAARDLGLISPASALALARTELTACQSLPVYRGFPYTWYKTSTAAPTTTLVSTVDAGWYEQGLVVARDAFPTLTGFSTLISAMNWNFLYDPTRNLLVTGYVVGTGPTTSGYDYIGGGPRIADYMAIGSRTVPGALWWGPRRTPPPSSTKPQTPVGSTVTYTDPQSGAAYSVFEGHYSYGGTSYVPSYYGGMFEAIAPNLVIPETTWAPKSLGLNAARTVAVQRAFANTLWSSGVWGLAPATVPGTTTGYSVYGAPPLGASVTAAADSAVAPSAAALALPIDPAAAYQDLVALRSRFPGIETSRGMLDSVDPATGSLAQRWMAVSQAVIMDSIDNTLTSGSLQSYIAADPFGAVIRPYLNLETFTLS